MKKRVLKFSSKSTFLQDRNTNTTTANANYKYTTTTSVSLQSAHWLLIHRGVARGGPGVPVTPPW